ncbi:hypothetical protein NPX13_g4989 [Xylaria arbuscula]|uniref:Transmembrane protein n=1 Tax=Xylaria arbuscula TaxID=114810 RepID=A0A9W8NFF6_9PEZI|nr:hypothetical protein NPX13_g4989 [Xylaria arbuscula]
MVAATREASSYNHGAEPSIEVASSTFERELLSRRAVLDEVESLRVTEEQMGAEIHPTTTADPTNKPVERDLSILQTPTPTATPPIRRRLDDGQIQALSSQLQSLSQSATQAISSVSSSASSMLSLISQSAQSVRQSADQAAQSADQANRELSQTRSSASSAVSAANARASDQLSQSLASMSSRISSAQSSASDAISSARVAASQFAASQIQAAQVGATDVTGDTNPQMNQAQPTSISTTNLAIIVVVSIIGTAAVSTASACLFLRYRQKRKPSRLEEAQAGEEKKYAKAIAVRGTLSPRFPRFGGPFKSPENEFRLPDLSPLIESKRAQREKRDNIGSAVSDYGEQGETSGTGRQAETIEPVQPSAFRLQKDNGVSNATTVRLIRVNSEKSKAESSAAIQETPTEPVPPPPILTAPDRSPALPQLSPQASTSVNQSQRENRPPSERLISARSTRTLDTETPGWRPPTISAENNRNRYRFRDSSDLESAEPTPTNLPRQATGSRIDMTRTTSLGLPKNARGTFATFPRIRNPAERESMMNRGRPNLDSRVSRLGESRRG